MTEPRDALAAWDGMGDAELSPVAGGLINDSYEVQSSRGRFKLQRLNAIFDPQIHHNIQAVTERLKGRGIITPELIETRDGRLWTDGPWRLMTFIEGENFDSVDSPGRAEEASRLVGRWHAALDDLSHSFTGLRLGVHDTDGHLAKLRAALQSHGHHRLHREVKALANELFDAVEKLPTLAPLARQVCHGDLKISNLLFDGERAICLIDLDTVGPTALAHELGDAWRSWCNPNSENVTAARFDLRLFEASWRGYTSTCSRPLDEPLRRNLLHGVEWISLELAVRFAADALNERYFGWDVSRHPAAGEHNLERARGQWALHRATLATRTERATILSL